MCSSYRPDTAAVATRSAGLVNALRVTFAQTLVLSSGRSRRFDGVRVKGLGLPTPSNTLPLFARLIQEVVFSIWAALWLFMLLPWSGGGRPVVVVSTPPFWLALVVALAARLRGASLAVDVRDRYPDVFFALGLLPRHSASARLLLSAEAWLYRQAVLTTTVTQVIATGIAHDHCGQEVALVRNGFDPQLFAPDPTLIPPAADQPMRVIMHGMFGHFFDLEVFASLLDGIQQRRLPVTLLVVGSGPQLSAVKRLHCTQLKIHDPMPQDAIARLIATCHLGLALGVDNASMHGTFPTKLFESLGCGLPVLVFPRSEAGLELASRGMGWSFSATETTAAIDTLERLCCDPALWQQARQLVLAQRLDYVRGQQAQHFAQLLAGALDQSSTSTPTPPIQER